MSNSFVKFALFLLLALIISFVLHAWFIHFSKIEVGISLLIITYAFNYVLTIVFFGVLLHFNRKRSDQLGFIFMFSSLAKFILFFALLKPYFQSLEISKSILFWGFFVPYAISLTLECIALIRILKEAK